MARVLVVFSSVFGANAQLAQLTEAALASVGAQARVRRVREIVMDDVVRPEAAEAEIVSAEDLDWADGIVLTSPSHTGLPSASVKAFIDEHHDSAVHGTFVNKTFAAMATSGFAHAGQERVVDSLNAVGAAWGCVLVPPSTADPTINKLDGNPFGLSFVLSHGRLPDSEVAAEVLSEYFRRFTAVTEALAPLRAATSRGSAPGKVTDGAAGPASGEATGVRRPAHEPTTIADQLN